MEKQKHLITPPLQYTRQMLQADESGERQSRAEHEISMRLFYSYTTYSLEQHAHYAYDSIIEAFPLSAEQKRKIHYPDVVKALEAVLERWDEALENKQYPTPDEADQVTRELVIYGLLLTHPELVTVVPGSMVICKYRMPIPHQPWIHPIYIGFVEEPGDDPKVWNERNSERYHCETTGKARVRYYTNWPYEKDQEHSFVQQDSVTSLVPVSEEIANLNHLEKVRRLLGEEAAACWERVM